ncbi:iron-containing alcohol dehydrogenase family protein [Variovorax sp. LjRoot178]|uniref:iron-containing alcohol dehydrogenase family protein n=1 Tax=Variovorax sp. LjRoot178 TaxID=3342277 RepID=UPI003ECEB632
MATELRLYHGSDSLASLQKELERAGSRRAVVVCGRTISLSDALARMRESLGSSIVAVAASARENSPVSGVEEAARTITQNDADAIIAVGGGSAAVTSRAAAILVGEKKPLRELSTQRLPDGKFESPRLNAPKLPLFVIPTTPSTAFAKGGTAVHEDDGTRLAMFDPKTRARAIFIHPDFVGTAPAELARNAGLNAFTNAVEALESPKCDPMSEAFLMQALRLLRRNLASVAEAGTTARENLVVAAILCGRGTEQAGAGLASVLAHAIGHRAHVANGIVGSIVLPHTMHYNSPVTAQRVGTILESLGGPEQADAGATVATFLKQVGAPTKLREIDVELAALRPIAEAAMQDWFVSRNARLVKDAGALLEILKAAW